MLRKLASAVVGAAALLACALPAQAQDAVRVGLILPLTGPFAPTGRQIEAGVRLYMQQHGATVAGKKIELIVKDDANVADNTKRIAQEFVVNEKVNVLAGFGLTPLALATAPIATEAKVPMVVMGAATAIIPDRSPYIVRTSQVTSQTTVGIADWAPRTASRGRHAGERLCAGHRHREVVQRPLQGRRRRDRRADPRAARQSRFRAVPAARPRRQARGPVRVRAAGVGSIFMKQFVERGLDKSGIRLIGTGDMTDDDILNGIGDVGARHHHLAPLLGRCIPPTSTRSSSPTSRKASTCARTSWASPATTACS